jgi:hypothetical protein
MRPKKITVTGTGQSAWIPVDYKQDPCNIGLAGTVSATATYGVEHTFDDIYDTAVTPIAFPNATIPAGTTANKDGNIAFPVRAVRLNVAASTGSVSLTIIQGLR